VDLVERSDNSNRRHPWEVSRSAFFRRLLEEYGGTAATSVLDVGAGDAWFAQRLLEVLPNGATMHCWDINYSAEDVEDPDLSPGLVLTPELPPGRFDGILMLDVVEHVEDDIGFVRDLVDGSLAPGGWALVSVPAYQSLFTAHDTALKHFRRYSPAQCRQVLEAAGLKIEREGSLFQSLLALRGAQKLKERLTGPGPSSEQGIGGWNGGESLTRITTGVLDAEGRLSIALSRHNRLVPGLSYWAWCRRAGDG
jgi:SAM-dependent methyltransferase